LVMDHTVVVGVGNIYANESLFRAGISPMRQSGRISRLRYERLTQCIRETIADAIKAGGSSLRDFFHSDGSQGYFQQQYFVYGRAGMSCRKCDNLIRLSRIGQRSTFSCPTCQT
jgi:formamidopyrimidine-DNA glycosylase